MRKATLKGIFLFVSLALSGSSFANIFENTPSTPPTTTEEILFNVSNSGFIYMAGSVCGVITGSNTQSIQYTNCSIVGRAPTVVAIEYDRVQFSQNSETNQWEEIGRTLNIQGTFYGESTSTVECQTPNTHLKDGLCYNPITLGENDSCDGNEITPASSGSDASVCLTKADGSLCEANLSEDGKFFVTSFESGSVCYDTNAPNSLITTLGIMPTPEQCLGTVNGTLVCNFSDPTITNGDDDNKVCGTYSSDDSQTKFVCFDTDENDNGIVDHRDPANGEPVAPTDPTIEPPPPTTVTGDTDLERNALIGSLTDAVNLQSTEQKKTQESIDKTTKAVDEQTGMIKAKLDELNINLSTVPNGIPTTQDIDNAVEGALDSITNTIDSGMAKGISENCDEQGNCGNSLQSSQVDFLDTAFGSFSTSSCVNPVWLNQTLDFCSRAPDINKMLYWIVAMLTIIGIWQELHSSVRRNT